jgi:UDP-glucuronate 4-epimerase
MPKTVLVTGAAGFIGSHLAEALLRRGDTVVGLDSFNDYYSPARKRQNVAEVKAAVASSAPFRFVEGDVRDRELLERVFGAEPIDAVAHLAAMPGVRASLEKPRLYFDVNLGGTLELLEQARQHRPTSFVLASTSSVYGASERIPYVETDSCDRPLAPYPASKRAAELLAYSYHHAHGLPVTALRFFTVYGPRGRPDMMPYRILAHLLLGEDLALYAHGKMLRDWTYVGDIVSGILAAIDRPLGYELINLGRGQPVAVADFIAEVERQTGKRARLRDEQAPATDMNFTHADLTKAKALLGYAPSVSVDEGIRRFCRWFREVVLEEA